MKQPVVAYLVFGALIMVQAVCRGLAKPRDLEDICTLLGMGLIWPIVIVAEIVTYLRRER